MRNAKTLLDEAIALETDEAELAWTEGLEPEEQELFLRLVGHATKAIKLFGRIARDEIEFDDLSPEEWQELYSVDSERLAGQVLNAVMARSRR